MIVGHVPRALSAVCCLFLGKGGTIFCEVTGRRRFSAGLPQGGLEVPCTGAGKYIAGSGVTGNLASPVYGTPESNILGKINTPVQFFLVSTVLSKFSHQEILYPPHAAAAPWRENR